MVDVLLHVSEAPPPPLQQPWPTARLHLAWSALARTLTSFLSYDDDSRGGPAADAIAYIIGSASKCLTGCCAVAEVQQRERQQREQAAGAVEGTLAGSLPNSEATAATSKGGPAPAEPGAYGVGKCRRNSTVWRAHSACVRGRGCCNPGYRHAACWFGRDLRSMCSRQPTVCASVRQAGDGSHTGACGRACCWLGSPASSSLRTAQPAGASCDQALHCSFVRSCPSPGGSIRSCGRGLSCPHLLALAGCTTRSQHCLCI